MGSMRSGVSQASTPDGTELALSAAEQTGSESFDEVDSLQVEVIYIYMYSVRYNTHCIADSSNWCCIVFS